MIVVYGFRQCRVHCVLTPTDPLTGRSRRQLRLRLGAFHTRVDSCALRLPSSRVHNSLLDDLVQVAGQQVLLRLAVLAQTNGISCGQAGKLTLGAYDEAHLVQQLDVLCRLLVDRPAA